MYLELNLENYRFYDEADSEREAILKIINDDTISSSKSKFLVLLKHIAANGLNPADITIVTPRGNGKFIVLEANRRLAALKLLETPEIIIDSDAPLYNKIKPISDSYLDDPITEVLCVIFAEPEDSDLWIELKHTGQNDGAGTIGWNMQQQERFRGGNNVAIQALDFLKGSEHTDGILVNQLSSVKASHISRLLGDPDVRQEIGLSMNEGKLYSFLDDKQTVKGLSSLIKRTLKPKFSVNLIRHKSDRIRFIKGFPKSALPSKKRKFNPWSLDEKPSSQEPAGHTNSVGDKEQKKNKSKKRRSKSSARKRLIPLSCKIRIEETKPNDIYHELGAINVDDYPQAVGVLFRVFIEVSIDMDIEKKNIPTRPNDRINDKMKKVCNYLQSEGILGKNELLAARDVANDDNNFLSVNTFHAFVHNPRYSPVPNDLKARWDNLQLFMETIWENY